jgi:hypothetical protein
MNRPGESGVSRPGESGNSTFSPPSLPSLRAGSRGRARLWLWRTRCARLTALIKTGLDPVQTGAVPDRLAVPPTGSAALADVTVGARGGWSPNWTRPTAVRTPRPAVPGEGRQPVYRDQAAVLAGEQEAHAWGNLGRLGRHQRQRKLVELRAIHHPRPALTLQEFFHKPGIQ